MRRSLLALLVLLAGCATDPTEVMLVVDGEFVTPTEVDSIDISVDPPNGDPKSVVVPVDGEAGFPRILGIVRGGGGAGEYVVTVTAKLGGATVVSRRASFEFRKDEVRMLRVDLLRDCQGVVCSGSNRTCGDMALCDRIATETEAWNGSPSGSQFDAGMSIDPIVVP